MNQCPVSSVHVSWCIISCSYSRLWHVVDVLGGFELILGSTCSRCLCIITYAARHDFEDKSVQCFAVVSVSLASFNEWQYFLITFCRQQRSAHIAVRPYVESLRFYGTSAENCCSAKRQDILGTVLTTAIINSLKQCNKYLTSSHLNL